jgi:hypothetical protein
LDRRDLNEFLLKNVMIKITNCTFLRRFKINGVVFYPFVLFCDKLPSERIISHEQIHIDQIKKVGALTFYFSYIKQYLLGRRHGLNHDQAYRNISFEKEAYSNELK